MTDENLFLALLLDPALQGSVTRRAARSVQVHEFTGKPVAAERLHLSLLNFARVKQAGIEAKVSAIAAAVRFAPFEITLDTAMSFRIRGKDRHPFVLTGERGVEGVRALHRMLHDWFFGDDFTGRKAQALTPHLTLLYDQKIVPQYALEQPLVWTARDFVFVRSYVGQSRYDILGRWPLIPDEDVTTGR